MLSKLLLISFFSFFQMLLWAETKDVRIITDNDSKPDTSYITPYYEDPIVEIGTIVRYPDYSINPHTKKKLNFTAGLQFYVDLYLYWKWIAIGYELGIYNHYRNNFDFSFSTLIHNFYLDLNVSRLRNYRLSNEKKYMALLGIDDESNLVLNGIETSNLSGNIEWIANNKRFSGNSAFSQSYSEAQSISAGSLIAGLTVAENRFVMNENKNENPVIREILQSIPVKSNRFLSFSLGCGYGYNFVPEKHWVITVSDVPYIAVARSHYLLYQKEYVSWCPGFRNRFRIGCTYRFKYGFVGASMETYNFLFYESNFTYTHGVIMGEIHFALKLGMFGVKSNKIPGHKIVDFIGRIL